MDSTTKRSLRKILDYLRDDEEEHWLESGMPKSGHIYPHIVRVGLWLSAAHQKNHAQDTQPTTITRGNRARTP